MSWLPRTSNGMVLNHLTAVQQRAKDPKARAKEQVAKAPSPAMQFSAVGTTFTVRDDTLEQYLNSRLFPTTATTTAIITAATLSGTAGLSFGNAIGSAGKGL